MSRKNKRNQKSKKNKRKGKKKMSYVALLVDEADELRDVLLNVENKGGKYCFVCATNTENSSHFVEIFGLYCKKEVTSVPFEVDDWSQIPYIN